MATALKTLNFNVGVVGHIDSGKTCLAKVLSTVASTASFDKNPQSQQRGITIDLGFSSFVVDFPERLRCGESTTSFNKLQFTLVDCPGHASLIRTIIGGSHITDMMLLVVDATKGFQTQTAECLVLGEITTPKMVVALNKIDIFPEDKRDSMFMKMRSKIQKTLEKTKFCDAPIIAVSAKPGGTEAGIAEAIGIKDLIEALILTTYIPQRSSKGPFIFAVDHCFLIRGQGTVLTGTVTSGRVAVGDSVEIPSLHEIRKVKSIQMFRKPQDFAIQGDRVGICVTQFEAKHLERGVVSSPGALPVLYGAIATVEPIKYYKGKICTKAKYHISLGHETVMAMCRYFSMDTEESKPDETSFNWNNEYSYLDELMMNTNTKSEDPHTVAKKTFVLLEFERPVIAPLHCLIIGSKLDTEVNQNLCRLAFHGRLLFGIDDKNFHQTVLPKLKVFKVKKKEGVVERMLDTYNVIVRALLKKETNIKTFVGLKVELSTGEKGVIEGTFGQSGKIKIYVSGGLQDTTVGLLNKEKKTSKGKQETSENATQNVSGKGGIKVILTFKRYLYDINKKLIQS